MHDGGNIVRFLPVRAFPLHRNSEAFIFPQTVFQPVIQRIFHQRLKDEVREGDRGKGIINVVDDLDIFAVRKKLDLDIGLDILQLILQCGGILPLVQGRAVKGGQKDDHIADIVLAGEDGAAVDQGQNCIENEG